MKKPLKIRLGIALGILCGLSIQCFNPNLPTVVVVSPEPGVPVVAPALPHDQFVEVNVPLPGCGAAAFPVDPRTFTATLLGMHDGKVVNEEDVTSLFGSAVLDPDTGAYAWEGNVPLPDYGEYEMAFSVTNEQGPGSGLLELSLGPPVNEFPGGWYLMSLSSMAQSPAECLGPQILLAVVHSVIKDLVFPLTLPSAEEILDADNAYPISLRINPMMPSIPMVLRVDEQANEILMDGPDEFTYNLSGEFPYPGLDCIIKAAIDGVLKDLDPQDPDGRLTLDLSVDAVPGGECVLVPAGDECALILGLDADVD